MCLLRTAGMPFHLPFRKCALPGLHMNALREMPENHFECFPPAGQHLPTGCLPGSPIQVPFHFLPSLLLADLGEQEAALTHWAEVRLSLPTAPAQGGKPKHSNLAKALGPTEPGKDMGF